MKIFQYTYYFLRSLYYRGIVNTFKLLSYESKFEKQLQIHTHSIVNLDYLTLAGDNSKENHHYQGASYFILFSVFNKLPHEIKHSPFIDYGCGKGRALFVAEQCGFTKLYGVDIAKELIQDAQNNTLSYKKKNQESSFHFIFSDAITYAIPRDAQVFYFFNPFGESILKKVLDNIKTSVENFPRAIYCIYLNPKYQHVFIEGGFNIKSIEKNKRYTEAIVYTLN